MANLGKCPDCGPGTRDRILINGKCPHHNENPVKGAKAARTEPPAKKKPSGKKKIPRRSKKGQEEDRIYFAMLPDFLREKPVCEIKLPGCWIKSTQAHHTKGRGKWYLVKSTWKACCSGPCHTVITEKSKQAIKDGHSQRRNTAIEPAPYNRKANG